MAPAIASARHRCRVTSATSASGLRARQTVRAQELPLVRPDTRATEQTARSPTGRAAPGTLTARASTARHFRAVARFAARSTAPTQRATTPHAEQKRSAHPVVLPASTTPERSALRRPATPLVTPSHKRPATTRGHALRVEPLRTATTAKPVRTQCVSRTAPAVRLARAALASTVARETRSQSLGQLPSFSPELSAVHAAPPAPAPAQLRRHFRRRARVPQTPVPNRGCASPATTFPARRV